MRYNTEYTDRYRMAMQEYVMTQRPRMNRTDIATAGTKAHDIMTQTAHWLTVDF